MLADIRQDLLEQNPSTLTLAEWVPKSIGANSKLASAPGLAAVERLLGETVRTAPPTPAPTIVWRGMRLQWDVADAIAANHEPFVTRSPQSWSRSPSVAAGFSSSNVLFGLLVPDGTRLADLALQRLSGGTTDDGKKLTIGHYPDEWEVVVPRGSRLRVLAAFFTNRRAKWVKLEDERVDASAAVKETDRPRPLILMELLPPNDASRRVSKHAVRTYRPRASAVDYSAPDAPLGARASSDIRRRPAPKPVATSRTRSLA